MKIYHSINDFPSDVRTVVTTGTFDGVHKGHRVVIDCINKIAKEEGLESLVFTLDPHPRHVLYPDDQELRLINTIDEKIEFLSQTGLQHLVVHKFTKDFSRMKSVNFIRDVLVNQLNMCYMVVGFDHHFGRNREGTFNNLLELSHFYGFKLDQIDPQNIGDVTVSSTKIRNAIKEGDFKKANTYLSSDFSFTGRVVKGNSLGRKIDFPTANIELNSRWKILPKSGVYAVRVFLRGEKRFGMLNLGNRPSIGDNSFVIEVHLFDFDDVIYNEDLRIEFVERVRDEKKFPNLESLQSQLKIDEIDCRTIFRLGD